MDNDSPLGSLVGALFLGGMYFFGRCQGEKQVRREWSDHERDQEILKLRKELEALKVKQISESS